MSAIVRIVLLPRFTSLYGSTTFRTAPLNVRAFASVILTAWYGTGLGGTPASAEFTLEQSADLGLWHPVGSSFAPAGPETEIVAARDLTLEWARLSVAVTGATPGVAVWTVGAFAKREG